MIGRVVVGHQPQFMPYLGILNKISKADVYVIVDHVQFVKKYFHNRTYIKVHDEAQLLTVPVLTKSGSFAPISEIKINHTEPWIRKHLKSLALAYQSTEFFDAFFPKIEEIYMKRHEHLAAFTSELLVFFIREFELVDDIRSSSAMGLSAKKTELLVELTRAVDGTTYVSGEGSRDYFDEGLFARSGYKHVFNEFQHPVYPQKGRKFLPGMGCVDVLFNCGKDGRKYIASPEGYLP